jgi:hypothetical protein
MQGDFVNYVNSTMQEVNDLSAELYEGLIDKEFDSVQEIIKKFNLVLRDITKTIQYEYQG